MKQPKINKPFPEFVTKAKLGKRTLGFLIDILLFAGVALGLWYSIGVNVILPSTNYESSILAYNNAAEESHLAYYEADTLTEFSFGAAKQTTWKQTYGIDVEDNAYSYKAMEKVVFDYYYVALGEANGQATSLIFQESDGFNPTSSKGSEEYKQELGKWIYESVFAKKENGSTYFTLVGVSDYTALPALSDEYAGKVASSDATVKETALQDLYTFFDNKSATTVDEYGLYQQAIINFNKQPVVQTSSNDASNARALALLPSFVGGPLLVFLVLPLCLKGRSLGKRAVGTIIVGKNGYQPSFWQVAGHYFFLSLPLYLLALPQSTITIPIVFGLYLFDYLSVSLSRNGLSFHDRFSGTTVAIKKKSQIFYSEEEARAYGIRNGGEVGEFFQVPAPKPVEEIPVEPAPEESKTE